MAPKIAEVKPIGTHSAQDVLAGKETRKLNFGRADSPGLVVLHCVPREARTVARKEAITTRVRLDLLAGR